MKQREIKARGWNPDTKRWFYGSYVRLERSTPYPMSHTPDVDAAKFEAEQVDHYIFFTESMDWGLPTRKLKATVDPRSVGQHTGLHDKNRVEIYEGDVVRLGTHVALVEFEAPCFEAIHEDVNDDGHLVIDLLDKGCTVLGNIYQNPELLQGGEVKDAA